MKIVDIKKFIRGIVMIIFVFLIILTGITKVTYSYKESTKKVICVTRGDTLWSIAKNEQQNNKYKTY